MDDVTPYIGKIVRCGPLNTHNQMRQGKRRPVIVIGSGEQYHTDPNSVVVMPCTLTLYPNLASNYISLFNQTKEGQYAGVVDVGACLAVPKNLFYRKPHIEDELLPDFFADVKSIVDQGYHFPYCENIQKPLYGEFEPPSRQLGYVTLLNRSAQHIYRHRRNWLMPVYVLGGGAEYRFYPNSLICALFTDEHPAGFPNMRRQLPAFYTHAVYPSPDRIVAFPANCLYFPTRAGVLVPPNYDILEKMKVGLTRDSIDSSELDRYLKDLGPDRNNLGARKATYGNELG